MDIKIDKYIWICGMLLNERCEGVPQNHGSYTVISRTGTVMQYRVDSSAAVIDYFCSQVIID